MTRERDEFGYPQVTKEEWHQGVTPEDIENHEMMVRLFKVVTILAGLMFLLVVAIMGAVVYIGSLISG